MVGYRRALALRQKQLARQLNDQENWLPATWEPSSMPAELVAQLRAGVMQAGHLGRLHQALERVGRGEPLVLAAVGASVTSDFGGIVGEMQDRHRLGYIGHPGRCHTQCVHFGWLLPIFRFLTRGTNGSLAQNPASAVVNCGQAARQVSTYLDCTASAVPHTADIIIMDGANGMAPINGNQFKPTERVLRRLLALPHRPAVLLLHWLDWCGCTEYSTHCPQGARIDRHHNRTCYTKEGLSQSWNMARLREETGWALLAEHYRLPVLSVRRAFHPLRLAASRGGDDESNGRASSAAARTASLLPEDPMSAGDGATPKLSRRSAKDSNSHKESGSGSTHQNPPSSMVKPAELPLLTWDGLHPWRCGALDWRSCRYSLLIAALVNTFIADAAAGRWNTRQSTDRDALLVRCNPVRLGTRIDHRGLREACFGWGIERRLPPPVLSSDGWKVTSMDTSHSFNPPSHCSKRRTRAAVHSSKSNSSDGGSRSMAVLPSTAPAAPPESCPKAKPGLTAFEPGSAAIFSLPLSTDATLWGPAFGAARRHATDGKGSVRAAQRTMEMHSVGIAADMKGRVATQNATLLLTYLSSYEGMGAAAVSCTRGCACPETIVDAQRTEVSNALSHAFLSLWETRRIDVLILGDLPSCTVRVELLRANRSSSSIIRAGHKFKLSALTLRIYDGSLQNETTACQAKTRQYN